MYDVKVTPPCMKYLTFYYLFQHTYLCMYIIQGTLSGTFGQENMQRTKYHILDKKECRTWNKEQKRESYLDFSNKVGKKEIGTL